MLLWSWFLIASDALLILSLLSGAGHPQGGLSAARGWGWVRPAPQFQSWLVCKFHWLCSVVLVLTECVYVCDWFLFFKLFKLFVVNSIVLPQAELHRLLLKLWQPLVFLLASQLLAAVCLLGYACLSLQSLRPSVRAQVGALFKGGLFSKEAATNKQQCWKLTALPAAWNLMSSYVMLGYVAICK